MKKLFLVLAAVLFLFGNVASSSAGALYQCSGVMTNEILAGIFFYPLGEVTDPPLHDLVFVDGFVPTPGGSFTDADVESCGIYGQDRSDVRLPWLPGETITGTFNAADATVIETFEWNSTALGPVTVSFDAATGIYNVVGNPSGQDEVLNNATWTSEGGEPPPEFEGTTGIQIIGTTSNITTNVQAGDTVEFTVNTVVMEKQAPPVEYRFSVRAGYGEPDWGGNEWTIVQEYSDNNTVMHTFDVPGIYFLVGHVIHPSDTWVFGYPQSGIVVEVCPTCIDADNDGYYSTIGCGTARDCDDNDASINPGADESCDDDKDNDCDGSVNEGCDVCVVDFPDPNLEAVIRETINKSTGDIMCSDLAPLSTLSAVEIGIVSLEGLQHCTNLTKLYLQYNQISDVSPLAGLVNLTNLLIDQNQISDVSPLAGLVNLKQLWLHGNQISDVSALAGLVNLARLWLSGNQISDVSPLAGLVNLRTLDLESNQISDVSPLAGLINLKQLWLQYNQISDVSPLAGLVNLTELSLYSNQITDVSPLAGLVDLTYLSLVRNQISDVSPLAGLVNLRYLYLRNNQISDVNPLLNNVGLGAGDVIVLVGNPLSITSCTDYIPQLEDRGVTVTDDCDTLY